MKGGTKMKVRYEVIFDNDNSDNMVLRRNGKIVHDIQNMSDFCEWLQESLVTFELVYKDDFIQVHRTVNS